MVNSQLLKDLESLSGSDVERRFKIISNIILTVSENRVEDVVCTKYKDVLCKNNEVLNYLLNRLIRGICSSRNSVRVGFSLCLSLCIKKWRDAILLSPILNLLFESTEVSKNASKGQERDINLGLIWGSFSFHQGDVIPLMEHEEVKRIVERLLQINNKTPSLAQCVSFILYLIIRDSSKIEYLSKLSGGLYVEILVANHNNIKLTSNYIWDKLKTDFQNDSNLYHTIPLSWFVAFEYLKEANEFFNLWYLFSFEIFANPHSDDLIFSALLFSPVVVLLSIEKTNGLNEFFKNGLDYIKYLTRPKKSLNAASQLSLDSILSILNKKGSYDEILSSFITFSNLLNNSTISSFNISFDSFEIFEYIFASDNDNKLNRLFSAIEESITFNISIDTLITRIDFALWFANYSTKYRFEIISTISKQAIKLNGKNGFLYTKILNKILSTKNFDLFKDEITLYPNKAINSCFVISEWYNSCVSSYNFIKRTSKILIKYHNSENYNKALSKFAIKLVTESGDTPGVGLLHTIGLIIWNETCIHFNKKLIYELIEPETNVIQHSKKDIEEEDDIVLDDSNLATILLKDDPAFKRMKQSAPSKWSNTSIDTRLKCLELFRIYINSWIKADDKTNILNQKVTLDVILSLFGDFVRINSKILTNNAKNMSTFSDKTQNVIMLTAKLLKFNNPKHSKINTTQKRIFELCNTKKLNKEGIKKVHSLGFKLIEILDEYNTREDVKIGGINLVNVCLSDRNYGGSALYLLSTNLPRVFTRFDLEKARVPSLAGLVLEAATNASKKKAVNKEDFLPQLKHVQKYVKERYTTISLPKCIEKSLKKFSLSVDPNNSLLEGASNGT